MDDWTPEERRALRDHAVHTRLTPAEEARIRARMSVAPSRLPWFLAAGVAVAVTALILARPSETSVIHPNVSNVSNVSPRETVIHPASVLADGDVSPAPGVKLAVAGAGTVEGSDKDLTVRWDAGELGVEVEPGQGIAFAVETAEADVHVIGTGFTVRRDAFGTSVAVRHGVVSVKCAEGADSKLTEGQAVTCSPTSAAALLGMANAMRLRGDAPTVVLAAARAGLAKAEHGSPVEGELALVEVESLIAAADRASALAAAQSHLASGIAHRRAELEAYVAQLSQ